MKYAEYNCLACSAEWEQPPGPTSCPACGHVYVKWTNYESDFAKGINNGRKTEGDVCAN